MLTRPEQLTDEVVADALHAGWGVAPACLSYLPVGFGSHHWRMADHADNSWFVTVDDLRAQWRPADLPTDAAYDALRAALTTARAVRDLGATFVSAPVRAVDGGVVRRLADRWALALYPYVEGRAREWGAELTTSDRLAVLDLIVTLHEAPTGEAHVDDLRVANRATLTTALDELTARWDGGPYAEPARELLAAHASRLDDLLARYDELVAGVRAGQDGLVLTHGEPHSGNLIETRSGWVLVDWDTTLVAPPERDIWMLDPGDGTIAAAYGELTGRAISSSALDLYRLRWDLADIAGFVSHLRRPHGDTDDDRKTWECLRRTVEALARW